MRPRPDALTAMEMIGPYRALDLVFTIDVDDPELAEGLGAVFSCMETAEPPAVRYRVETRRRHAVSVAGTTREFRSPHEVLPWLLWKVNNDVLQRTSGLVLHGAAVVIDGAAIALCGRSGAGKSTLVASLVAAGHPYLTDEAVAVGVDHTVRGWTRPLALAPEARVLLGLRPEQSVPVGVHGEHLVSPGVIGPMASAGPWPLGGVMLLTGEVAGRTDGREENRSSRAQDIVELTSHILTPARVDEPTIRSLSSAVAGVPLGRLARHVPSEMVGRVVAMARLPRSRG